MCGIWDWQSTIVKDLNDSQDPKHTLFCRENVFVAIYALFSDNKCPLFTRLGGVGSPKADIVCFFSHFSFMMASLTFVFGRRKNQQCTVHFAAAFVDPRLCPREFASNAFYRMGIWIQLVIHVVEQKVQGCGICSS